VPETLHASTVLIYAPLIGNMLLAIAAGGYALRRRPLPGWFWTATTLVVAVLAVQLVAGLVLFAVGTRPRRGLHVMYGVLTAVTAVIQFGLRPGGFLLSNNALLELPASRLRSVGYLTVPYSDRPDDGDHIVWYRRLPD